MIGGDGFETYWGFTGLNHHAILTNIVKRAIKFGGYTVVLLQPDGTEPACIATDAAIKRGHTCGPDNPDLLEQPEDLRKVSAMANAAVARATDRYGCVPNVGIPISTLQHPLPVTSVPVVGGLLIVPPSVVNGTVVRLVTD